MKLFHVALLLAVGLMVLAMPVAALTGPVHGTTQVQGATQNQGGSGTTLVDAAVTATPHWTTTYQWTIDKSVTPDALEMNCGDSGTVTYTITVTKDAGTEEAWIDGTITVKNDGAVATQDLAITVDVEDGYPPPNNFLTSAPVDVSSNPVLDPGEIGTYSYHVVIPITGGLYPQPHAGNPYKVTALITIMNHSGHIGTPYGPSPSTTITWPSSATLVNDAINVDDTNGGSWSFSNSGSVTYTKTFNCCGDAGTHTNTATIRETKQSDTATVTVTCHGSVPVPEFPLMVLPGCIIGLLGVMILVIKRHA